MKQIVTIILAALLLAACVNKKQQLQERAAELCQYIPDHQLNPEAKSYMTQISMQHSTPCSTICLKRKQ